MERSPASRLGIVAIDPEGGTERSIARNYESYLDALLEAFTSGAFVFDEIAGAYEAKETLWRPIATKHEVNDAW